MPRTVRAVTFALRPTTLRTGIFGHLGQTLAFEFGLDALGPRGALGCICIIGKSD